MHNVDAEILVARGDAQQTAKILTHILQQPHDYVGSIKAEILHAIARAPILTDKNPVIANCLDQLFGKHDWLAAFDRPQVIVYEEVITAEILQGMHAWLRTKATDITNIVLICTSNVDVADWWQRWSELYHEKSFQIREVFFTSPLGRSYWHDTFLGAEYRSQEYFQKNKSTDHLFVYRGGTYASHQREYVTLALIALALDGHVDHMAAFGDHDALLAYVEHQTYFGDQTHVDLISNQYRTHVDKNGTLATAQPALRLARGVDLSSQQRHQATHLQQHWDMDRTCWATVARETLDDNLFACVSEKILRAFWHHTVCMPLGYRAVAALERRGFWFPHDVVDYSYQTHRDFSSRVKGLCQELVRLSQCFTKHQLHRYYLDNIQNFQHNVTTVQKFLDDARHLARMCTRQESIVSGATA